jgi:hypothetical protein
MLVRRPAAKDFRVCWGLGLPPFPWQHMLAWNHAWAISFEAMVDSGERAVELGDYLDILRRRWLGVLIIALMTLALAAAVTLMIPRVYTTTTRLFIAAAEDAVTELAQGSNFAEKQMPSYTEVDTSPRILAPVIAQLDPPATPNELAEPVEANVPAVKVILDILATDRDPNRAVQIANTVSLQLAKAVGDLSAFFTFIILRGSLPQTTAALAVLAASIWWTREPTAQLAKQHGISAARDAVAPRSRLEARWHSI